jgi:hypothetical protein
MPNKIGLSEAPYFTVQAIYSGWWVLGLLWVAALVADVAFAVALRGQGAAFWLSAAGAALIVVVFAIFLVWTQPANAATSGWTTVPPNWEALRVQWEYSHAVNAGLLILALCCVAVAAVMDRD